MNQQLQEKIQAWVDGELDASEASRLARVVDQDPVAKALADNLRGFRDLIRQHPLDAALDVSREFYWSRIRERISRTAAPERTGTPEAKHGAAWTRWLVWLVPTAAALAAVIVTFRPDPIPGSASVNSNALPMLVEHVVETPLPEVNTLTFYSAHDAMTVVWVGQADML